MTISGAAHVTGQGSKGALRWDDQTATRFVTTA